jgi:hypothetical protein
MRTLSCLQSTGKTLTPPEAIVKDGERKEGEEVGEVEDSSPAFRFPAM